MAEVMVRAPVAPPHEDSAWRLPVEPILAAASLGALGVAWYGAAQVTLPVDSDLGLAAVLPPTFWAGLLLLNLAMLAALRSPRASPALMLVLQLSLCFMVYGTPAFVSGTPRTEVVWRHLGIAGVLTESGTVDPGIDAYFNWPGFFAGLGALLETTGIDSTSVALWAPVGNGMLWVLGVACIVRALTDNEQHLWLALWFFTLTNWIDQDYLSSQAFAYFLYLVALALVLTLLSARPGVSLQGSVASFGIVSGARAWWSGRVLGEPSARLRVTGVLLTLVFCVTIVISHQLTPFVLLASVGVLTVLGRVAAPRLGAIIAIVVVLWLCTAASTYLAGHPLLFIEDSGAVESNVADRLGGSPGHVLVVQMRVAMALACWGLAGVGFLRLRRAGVRDLRPALLIAVPLAMVPVHTYGGEMLLRATLFAAPFTAYLAAAALMSSKPRMTPTRSVVLAVVCTVLAVGLVVSRFGNTRFDMFTEAEIGGVARLYEIAPAGSLLIAGAHPTPWRHRDYTAYRHTTLTDLCEPGLPTSCNAAIREQAEQHQGGVMLMLSRGNAASMRMQGYASSQQRAAFESRVSSTRGVRNVFRNEDVRIYHVLPGVEGAR